AGNAEIGGYRAAGKTGTAQAPSDSGGYDGYTSSFVGVAPVDDPRIAVSVTLQRPQEGYYGGTSAAPVFSDVAGFTLRHLHVPPSTGSPSDTPVEWED
ncbi:penicillin-binding transpeptidase domain-containing protein, partial [Brevibacterium sp.]